MKMIVRIDDVGYSDVHDLGSFRTIEQGIATSADVMLDTPGSESALRRLRDLPWISVGWHTHFWGAPILDPACVPSLVIAEEGRIRFRKDLHESESVDSGEALAECRAQIERCIRLLGRAPDVSLAVGDSVLARAIRTTCEEYGIAIDFAERKALFPGAPPPTPVADRWKASGIRMADGIVSIEPLMSDCLSVVDSYDPSGCLVEDRDGLLRLPPEVVSVLVFHPGYLDEYVHRKGDSGRLARNFLLSRLADVEALCSDRVKAWIRKNGIELITFRDALFGTHEYQNHLKVIGSDLAVT
jgi:chitin disaccharide deacetylase